MDETRAPVVFLAGGFGTRIRQVDPTRPKPMVLVAGKPFLHWLVARYVELGFREFILSTGYKAEVIENYSWSTEFPDSRFRFYREDIPLGTGGAIQSIFRHFDLKEAWVVNGDTYLPDSIPQELDICPPETEATYLALKKSELFDAEPNLHIKGPLVTEVKDGGEFFDAGAVFVRREAVERCALASPFPLHELLSFSIRMHKVGFHLLPGTCYDMGTPERLKRFEQFLRRK